MEPIRTLPTGAEAATRYARNERARGAAPVEDDVATQLAVLNEKVDRLCTAVDALYLRYRELEELKEDVMPMVKGAMVLATERLQHYEENGAQDFVREGARVLERVATSFTAEDVRLLGDNVVHILETVKGMTQPEMLDLADHALGVLQGPQAAEPVGVLGMVRASRDGEVRRGLGVLLALLRELGRQPDATNGKRALPEEGDEG